MNIGRYLRGEHLHVGTARVTKPAMSADRWVLVPVEPTPEMLRAGKWTLKGAADLLYEQQKAEVVYRSMIAATPGAAPVQSREPLTTEAMDEIVMSYFSRNTSPADWCRDVARAIERAHGIGSQP